MSELTDEELGMLAEQGFFGPVPGWQCPACGHYTIWRRKSNWYPNSEYVIECKCRRCDCDYKETHEY
jgi:hypothetical protein